MLAVVAALLMFVMVAQADIASASSVIDGDTIESHGQQIGLGGNDDSAESRQTCQTPLSATSTSWPDG